MTVQQFKAIVERLDRIVALLAAERGVELDVDRDPCARCGGEDERMVYGADGKRYCAVCKGVVEEVPA
jgi:hypothetical protein